jgi:biopolymer transport protein ExbD
LNAFHSGVDREVMMTGQTEVSDQSMGLEDLQGILTQLTNLNAQADFEVIMEADGPEHAIPYAVAMNCFEALQEVGGDDWLKELIKGAYECLSPEAHESIDKNGL